MNKKEKIRALSLKKTWRLMRLSSILLTVSILSMSAANMHSQSAKLSLKMQQASLPEIFKQIENQSDFLFFYSNEDIDQNVKVNVNTDNQHVEELLNDVLRNTDLIYVIKDRHILLRTKDAAGNKLQGIFVTGIVIDKGGEPMPGVNVTVKGTTMGVITDVDGRYSITVPSKDAVLLFSFVGYTPQEIIVRDRTTIDVSLDEDSKLLEEVVVVGYGTMKKRDMLGSISTVKSDNIAKFQPSSIDVALQGMASGVSVTSSGVPGAPVQVKIRGISSISSGTDPLWIVDGIPVTSGTVGPDDFSGAVEQNVLSMINPSDIESIQVLKDAAATSIYGSRGSNGVIIVTTKSGKKGVNTLDVDIRTGISDWTKSNVNLASGREWIEIMDLAYKNSGTVNTDGSPKLYDPVNDGLKSMNGTRHNENITREEAMATHTNWADKISRLGNFIEARLSASNGSEKANSYLSLNYRKDNSILKFNDMQSISANANLNYNALSFLKLGYRVIASYTDNNRISSDEGSRGSGGWAQANSSSLPWMPVYDPNGPGGYWNPRLHTNALASIDSKNSENNLQTMNLITGLSADLNICKGFTLRGELGINYINSKAELWTSINVRDEGSRARENKADYITLNYNTYANYDVSLNNIHNINVVAGIEGTREHTHTTKLTATGLVGEFHEIGSPSNLSGSSKYGDESYLMGIFGRANYNFNNKYYAGFSMRRDGISKFISDNRWATFMSGSLGWIVSEEDFFNIEAINFLKLRGSFGQTGNTNVATGITEDYWQIFAWDRTFFPGYNRTSLSAMGNPNIKWETTSTVDIGFDFGLLNNRINGSVAWYNQKVEDMLLNAPVPESSGIATSTPGIYRNVGDMKNYGWEVNLDALIISKKDFRLNVGANFATNKNKVLALEPTIDASGVGILPVADDGSDIYRTIIKKDLPLGTWYMAEFAGVNKEMGYPMIYEVETLEDGSTRRTGNIIPATTINQDNNKMILKGKTSVPKITGGFNMSVAYKGFDFNMLWNFSAGHYIYNRQRQSRMTVNAGLLTLSNELLTDSWRNPGDNAKYPMVVTANRYEYVNDEGVLTTAQFGSENKTPNTLYLEKGDYLRLKSIQLGYTIPKKLTDGSIIKDIRVYASGTNLLTLTKFEGYDPEVLIPAASNGSVVSFNALPQARVFSIGVSAKF